MATTAQEDPPSTSRAAQDHRLPLGRTVLVMAGQALSLTGDHLLAIEAIFGQARTIPVFAHMTLMRSALESASRCRWLVDSEASAKVRIERGAITQMEALEEQRKFFALDGATPDARSTKKSVDDFANLMRGAGLNPSTRSVATDIFDTHGPGQWLWRLTSGFAHGREWALLSGTKLNVANVETGARSGQTQVKTSASIDVAIGTMSFTSSLAKRACDDFEDYLNASG